MNHSKKWLALLLALIMVVGTMAGCGKSAPAAPAPTEAPAAAPTEAPAPAPEEEPFESTFMDVKYSEAFSVEYLADGVKLITDADGRQTLLVPKGQEAPSGYDGAQVVATPIERALFASTTQVGMLVPYGDLRQWVKGVTDNGAWPFEDILAGLESGEITYVGNSYTPDYEVIQEMDPDITFVYTGSSAQTTMIDMLEQLGLPYVVDNEYMEATPEARMEWTKFLGAFFDLDEQACAYVDEQLDRLDEMAKTVANAEKPKVVWGMVYDGTVYAAAGNSYVAYEIEAAGGDYLFKDLKPEASQLTLEEFYEKLSEADIFIYSSNKEWCANYGALLEMAPVFEGAPPLENKQVYTIDVDFYYNTHLADLQVIDLAAIFHPDLYPDYQLTQYEPLAD